MAPLEMSIGLRAVQRSDQVYETLKENIISGRLPPNTRLQVDSLAKQLGVSSTPVRDALAVLESKGLITKTPYQGAVVKRFSVQEVRELYEVRVALETQTVELACERITQVELSALEDAQAAGLQAVRESDMEAYQLYNYGFHQAILGAARNSLLASFMDAIALQSRMMVAQSVQVTGRPEEAIREHESIIQALANRDSVAARSALRRHLNLALEDMLLKHETPKLSGPKLL